MIECNADRWRLDNGVWCTVQKSGRRWLWRVDRTLDGDGEPLYHGEAATPDEARRKANEAASWWMLA